MRVYILAWSLRLHVSSERREVHAIVSEIHALVGEIVGGLTTGRRPGGRGLQHLCAALTRGRGGAALRTAGGGGSGARGPQGICWRPHP